VQKAVTVNSVTTTTNYIYDGANVLEELDTSGHVLARYSQGAGIDQPLAELRSGTTSFYEADGLGSITSLSISAAALVNTYTYRTFGKLSVSTGTLTNPFQYTARDLDGESGFNYYRSRYYDQNTGRFINEDPIGFAGGINKFTYVGNNATNFIDPFGLWPKPLPSSLTDTVPCDSEEYAQCAQTCGSKGVQSCRVSRTFRATRFKDGLLLREWVKGPISCSCHEPKDNSKCEKNKTEEPDWNRNFWDAFWDGVGETLTLPPLPKPQPIPGLPPGLPVPVPVPVPVIP
jgi:RHS repeat-associated protein